MELSLRFENQTILKLPASIMEKIKGIEPGEQIGMLRYDENGERKWDLLNHTFSESKQMKKTIDSLKDDKSGFLFLENQDNKNVVSMYPSNIRNITRCGGLIDDDLRKKIEQGTKKSATVEDKKRIVGSIYESNSQPFIYYDRSADDFREPNGSVLKKRQVNINTSTPSTQNTNSSNDRALFTTPSTTGNTLEALKEKIFRIFEEKGSDGVSMKEIEEKTLKPKHILKRIIDEIAMQTGRGGRRHIWYLKPQYSTK